MHKPSSYKSTIAIVVIVAIALGAYFYYKGTDSSSSASLLTASAAGDPTQSGIGQQVLGLLSQIQSLRIDTKLFTDPGYQTLRDYSVQIPQENVGRPNPFAPLPGAPASPAATH